MTDWQHNKMMLLNETEPLIRGLLDRVEDNGAVLAAIGYAYEFGSGQLCFELCANTVTKAEKQLEPGLAWSDAVPDESRWNSGDYAYPGGVQDHFGGWSPVWWAELSRLDRLAEEAGVSEELHERMGATCCEVLAELANRGVFGDWSAIDFNVAALLDDRAEVKKRNQHIREVIRSSAEQVAPPDRGGG